MVEINLNTVEDVVLKNSRLRALLPDLQSYFDTWRTGQHVAGLKSLASRAKVDLLNTLQPQHLAVISKYLNQEVSLRTFDSRSVAHCDCQIEDTIHCLQGLEDYVEVSVCRRGENIHITAWR